MADPKFPKSSEEKVIVEGAEELEIMAAEEKANARAEARKVKEKAERLRAKERQKGFERHNAVVFEEESLDDKLAAAEARYRETAEKAAPAWTPIKKLVGGLSDEIQGLIYPVDARDYVQEPTMANAADWLTQWKFQPPGFSVSKFFENRRLTDLHSKLKAFVDEYGRTLADRGKLVQQYRQLKDKETRK